jgi:hypothetical protein
MTNRPAVARFLARLVPAAAAAGVIAWAAPASAQSPVWLSDRRVGEGKGIQAGDLELHPGIGAEGGYDSNYFLRTSDVGTAPKFLSNGANNPAQPFDAPPVDAGVLRVTPSFSLNTRSITPNAGGAVTTMPQLAPFYFSAGAAATFFTLFGKSPASDQRSVSGNANLRMDVNRGQPLGFDVYAGYSRLIQPTVIGDPDLSFNRSDVNAGADVVVIPGGGTLDLRLGYQFIGQLFEDTEGVPYTNLTHEISFRDRWRFRPRTALFHDTTLRFVSFPNASRALTYLDDSTPVRTRIGISGLVTDSIGTLLAVGYGASFFQNGAAATTPQYDSVNAQAEVTLYLSQAQGAGEPGQATLLLSNVTLGFMRDFQQSLVTNVYTSNKGYLKFNYFFGPRAIIQIGGEVGDQEYAAAFYNAGGGNPNPNAAVGPFTNIQLGAVGFGEYRITDSFAVNTTLRYDQIISDTLLPAAVAAAPAGGAAPAGQFYDMSWKRFQALIGLRYFL